MPEPFNDQGLYLAIGFGDQINRTLVLHPLAAPPHGAEPLAGLGHRGTGDLFESFHRCDDFHNRHGDASWR